MGEVNRYTKIRRKKKIRRRLVVGFILLVVGGAVFLVKSPSFNLKKITIKGQVTVSKEELELMVKDRIGENIFLVDRKSMKNHILSNKYIKSVEISQVGINELRVNIKEEAPIYFMTNGDNKIVFSNDLQILEETSDLGNRTLVEVKGLEVANIKNTTTLENKDTIIDILNKFEPFITENKEDIRIESIDVSDVIGIKGKIGDVDIYFGDITNLLEKMENIYRILLSEDNIITSGYINVSFEGDPIIKNNDTTNSEENTESQQNTENQQNIEE